MPGDTAGPPMIPVTTMAGKRVAVFGLGASGLATAHALAAGGAEIACFDDDRARVEAARNAGLPTGDLRVADFSQLDALVLTPGVPLTHPKPHWSVERARAAGIEVIGDIELFERERRHRFPAMRLVAITGTNGKSTTTVLLGHLLAALGQPLAVGGNIGDPILGLSPAPDAIVVLECSSYQIDLAPSLAPTVGVHLNLSVDHLDRHGDMIRYAAIKERLVAGSARAVVGVDDTASQQIADRAERAGKPVWRVSAAAPVTRGVVARDGDLYLVADAGERRLGTLVGANALRGRHNAQNAAAALAAVIALGLDGAAAAMHLASFPGLPHRLEEVGRAGGVLFINDSKATNAEAARQALSAFDRIYWIAGGVPKEGGIAPLADLFPRIAKAYLIGGSADAFAATLSGKVEATIAGTVEAAVHAAARDAAGDAADDPAAERVVLLSPACASYDQFPNYGARGDHFRDVVKRLIADTRRVA